MNLGSSGPKRNLERRLKLLSNPSIGRAKRILVRFWERKW